MPRPLAAAGAVTLLLTCGSPTAHAVVPDHVVATQQVGFFAAAPLPESGAPLGSLPAAAQQQLAPASPHPRTDTPRGYKLRQGGAATDYIYNSADVWAIDAHCDGSSCSPVQQVKLGLKEYVFGGDSRRWRLTLNSSPWSGPSGFSASYDYECGVNIPDDVDKTCATWKADGADGPTSGTAPNGTEVNHGFGRTTGVVKFPMVNLKVRFADGSTALGDDGNAGEKFRGWDVCVTAADSKLCPTTGKGD
ncbi:hypothetical protein OG455_27030 [Kitasatospora sp. NBC_01287]|uniref:hypothetical protein n=1 Tax=Kitasatospora sp. NBC_01287 TaxID=2903573 RepID=UPI0022586852|nr:hypothetical protein [Kitasatospora sp. NBC_01287]MCX4749120.1 hypothetical protein [Kitasatospora sp. NBC_01287]